MSLFVGDDDGDGVFLDLSTDLRKASRSLDISVKSSMDKDRSARLDDDDDDVDDAIVLHYCCCCCCCCCWNSFQTSVAESSLPIQLLLLLMQMMAQR